MRISVKFTIQRGPSGYALWANPTYSLRLFIVRGGAVGRVSAA